MASAASMGAVIHGALLAARQRRGLTQQQVADAIGTNRTHFARLESGLHEPTAPVLYAWAAAVGVELVPNIAHLSRAEGAVLDIITAAARDGRVCPSNDEICRAMGYASTASAVRIINALADAGAIAVERYQRGRKVTIIATGESTAQPADATPHRRDAQRGAA